MTFGAFLNDVGLGEAERLVRETDLTMEEIARNTGFNNSNYFTVCFKRMYYDTPLHYRKVHDMKSARMSSGRPEDVRNYEKLFPFLTVSVIMGKGTKCILPYRRYLMLVTAKEMLTKAKAGKYAVGQFNINNLEWTKAILQTAQELNSPVILGVSEGAGKYMTGYKTIVGMVNGMLEEMNITVPVALHLDHGSYDACMKCVEAGFSSIMFDGSHYPIEENVAKTTELVKICEENNMSLEAEVGSIGGEEDGVIGKGECADPDECKKIADLGVTMLAAGIGNIHGKYPENWEGLSFETLEAISNKTGDMPLVLHGGTGIPADQIKKAISLGVAKINVNTECRLVFAKKRHVNTLKRERIYREKDLILESCFCLEQKLLKRL